ncbi:MAG: discoidin domain-containing protein, partial [Lentisphaeria bacterium]
DVKSLLEFKKLRDQLYARDFAKGAKAKASQTRNNNEKNFGAKNLFDDNQDTYWAVDDKNITPSVEVKLKQKSTFDVVRVREYIRLGQRVDAWAVDAKINGNWQEVLVGSSIGQQAMLKLKEPVTTDEIRLRITDASATPILAELSLFKAPNFIQAPQIHSNNSGEITITAPNNATIYYTTDGKDPNQKSPKYDKAISLPNGGVIKSLAVIDNTASSITSKSFGLNRSKWTVQKSDGKNPNAAFDNDPRSNWIADKDRQTITINLGENTSFSGFSYLPRQDYIQHQMTTNYQFEISLDGKKWQRISNGEFGNLKANPIEQAIFFGKTFTAQFIRFTTLKSLEGKGGSIAEINLLP